MKYFSWKSIVQLSTFVYNNFMSQLPNCLLSLPHWPPRKQTPVFHLFIRCILSRMVNRWRSEGPQPHRHSESTRTASFGLLFVHLTSHFVPCGCSKHPAQGSKSLLHLPGYHPSSRQVGAGIQAGTGAVSCLLASAQLVFLWPEVVLPMVVCPLEPVRN